MTLAKYFINSKTFVMSESKLEIPQATNLLLSNYESHVSPPQNIIQLIHQSEIQITWGVSQS